MRPLFFSKGGSLRLLIIYSLIFSYELCASTSLCSGLLRDTANEELQILFFDGGRAREIEYVDGIAYSGRIVTRRVTSKGSFIYRHFRERDYYSEAEAELALQIDDGLRAVDEQFRRAEQYGGPRYYGLELIKLKQNVWSYFGVMDDYSTSETYFTYKGLGQAGQPTIFLARQMIEKNPAPFEKIAHDLVQDVNRGVARIDLDFIIRSDGTFWIDPEAWRFDQNLEKTLRISSSNISHIIRRLSGGLDAQVATREFANYVRKEIRELELPTRALFSRTLSGQLLEDAMVRGLLKVPISFDAELGTYIRKLEEDEIRNEN
jgi:hypothetical protein